MAFHDIDQLFYNGTIKIEYRDQAHRYFRRELVDSKWSKAIPVKGVTTILDNVLEKKGLMTWPMGLALRELFGFYNFVNESGEQMTGFSKGVGSLWDDEQYALDPYRSEDVMTRVLSASKSWQRKKKTGADVGNIVHDAIEHYTKKESFDFTLEHYKEGQVFESPEEEAAWDEKAREELDMALLAFSRFKDWWDNTNAKIIGTEQLVYSKSLDYAGTFDAVLEIEGKRYVVDYKTSAASSSRDAAAPQGVYYSYFIQSAAYAAAWEEMGNEPVDDLLIVSVRKDGGFDTVSATDLDLTVTECIEWWRAVALCHKLVTKTKKALLNNVKKEELV